MLLPGAPAHVAVDKAEDIRRKIEGVVVRYLDANLPRITISIGVAAFPQAGNNPQAVMKAADEALYRAKDDGRNCVRLAAAHRGATDTDSKEAGTKQGILATNFVQQSDQKTSNLSVVV